MTVTRLMAPQYMFGIRFVLRRCPVGSAEFGKKTTLDTVGR